MKYKIEKGSPLFDKFEEIRQRMIVCNQEAKDLCKELGGKAVATLGENAAGGIDAIEFDEKPEDWKVMGKPHQNLFYPKAKNKELLQKISALPKVKRSEIAELLGFKIQAISSSDGGLMMVSCPRTILRKEFVLIDMPTECKYTPVDGMTEILESEFVRLREATNKEMESDQ
jgi:hypothetical protein